MDLHRFELPERFNRLESMLFAAQPRQAQVVAERYVGDLLSRPVAPPLLVMAPRVAEPTALASLDV